MRPASGLTTLLSLPAYTTVTAQTFSPDGVFLACASERGRVALFKVNEIISRSQDDEALPIRRSPVFLHFEAGSSLDKGEKLGCVNGLVSTDDFLIAAISRPVGHEAAVVAFGWKDLAQKKARVSWSIEHSMGILPTDVNSLDVDANNDRLFVAGGVGQSSGGKNDNKDFAVRSIDMETRSESTRAMAGHTAFVHAVSCCGLTGRLATASEDGSARVWDPRARNPGTAVLEPGKNPDLSRPELGNWLGDVDVHGDWLVTGGGSKPALWHLRAMSPAAIPDHLPGKPAHVAKLVGRDDRLVFAGQFGGKVYHASMSGQPMAEVNVTAPCTYSVVASDVTGVMASAGASSKIDLCTHNFSYRDNTITFPVL